MFKHKHSMTSKTITITNEAYNKIKSLKHNYESFSDLFIRISENKNDAGKRFFGIFKTTTEEMINRRKHFKKLREDTSKDFEERLRRR